VDGHEDASVSVKVDEPTQGGRTPLLTWIDRNNRALTFVVGVIPPTLYLIFVNRYAVNSLQGDEWNQLAFLHAALHGHLSMGELWSQYGEPRIPLVRAYLLIFATFDHLDLRTVILGNALLFIVAYGMLLLVFRRYLGGRLTPVPVLAVGLIWFSLADVQNALWGFEVGWYLVTLGFVCMLGALLLPRGRSALWLAVAILAAVFATLAWIQGFVAWPVGLLCLVWTGSHRSNRIRAGAVWCGSTLVMVLIYFLGYNRTISSCKPVFGCIPTDPLTHPVAAARFLLVLIGNAVPGGFTDGAPHSYLRFEIVGAVLLAGAVYVIFQSWRWREQSERLPLPLLLVTFSLLFDATLVWGRVGAGPPGAINSNRYVMPNVILVVGIVMFAWAHRPWGRPSPASPSARRTLEWAALALVGVLVALQVVIATDFGIRGANLLKSFGTGRGQLTVNWNRVPPGIRSCEAVGLFVQGDLVPLAASDRLGEFGPTSYWYFRNLGPPAALGPCAKLTPSPPSKT